MKTGGVLLAALLLCAPAFATAIIAQGSLGDLEDPLVVGDKSFSNFSTGETDLSLINYVAFIDNNTYGLTFSSSEWVKSGSSFHYGDTLSYSVSVVGSAEAIIQMGASMDAEAEGPGAAEFIYVDVFGGGGQINLGIDKDGSVLSGSIPITSLTSLNVQNFIDLKVPGRPKEQGIFSLSNLFVQTESETPEIPEPASAGLAAAGLGVLLLLRARRGRAH